MMTLAFRRWFRYKWRVLTKGELERAYHVTFNNVDGQVVLQHLLDNIYCTTYGGTDPNEALIHNARRTVVQEILENIDLAENPKKYDIKVQTEETVNA